MRTKKISEIHEVAKKYDVNIALHTDQIAVTVSAVQGRQRELVIESRAILATVFMGHRHRGAVFDGATQVMTRLGGEVDRLQQAA